MAQRMIPAKTAAKMVRRAVEATKKAQEAKAQAHVKAFAAKMIVQLAKAAGIAAPPMRVRKAAMARGRKKAAAFRKRTAAKVAAARAKAQRMRAA
jgi:hypothetical protein